MRAESEARAAGNALTPLEVPAGRSGRRRSSECATVTVSDDGVGGANAANGTGLRGLADRIEALEGQFYLDSPLERGTRISAEIPIPSSPARA